MAGIDIDLAAHLAIQQLVAKYAKGRDTTDPDLYRQIFAEDAVIASGTGRVLSANLTEILQKVASDQTRFNPDFAPSGDTWSVMRHDVSNLIIDVDGDTAVCEYYVQSLAYNTADKRPELIGTARNVDQYERRDGRWWITRSTLHFGWENETMGRVLQVGPWTPPEHRR